MHITLYIAPTTNIPLRGRKNWALTPNSLSFSHSATLVSFQVYRALNTICNNTLLHIHLTSSVSKLTGHSTSYSISSSHPRKRMPCKCTPDHKQLSIIQLLCTHPIQMIFSSGLQTSSCKHLHLSKFIASQSAAPESTADIYKLPLQMEDINGNHIEVVKIEQGLFHTMGSISPVCPFFQTLFFVPSQPMVSKSRILFDGILSACGVATVIALVLFRTLGVGEWVLSWLQLTCIISVNHRRTSAAGSPIFRLVISATVAHTHPYLQGPAAFVVSLADSPLILTRVTRSWTASERDRCCFNVYGWMNAKGTLSRWGGKRYRWFVFISDVIN